MFQSPSRWGRCCIARYGASTSLPRCCFSPLLDGDGVASWPMSDQGYYSRTFQSPSRWGRCCIWLSLRRSILPYRMFQSPSRWGRCCILLASLPLAATAFVSVPFSMGTVLHLPADGSKPLDHSGFSPLLDGDGV